MMQAWADHLDALRTRARGKAGRSPRSRMRSGSNQTERAIEASLRPAAVSLWTLLIQGAKSAVFTAHRRSDRLSRWIVQLRERVGWQKAAVASTRAFSGRGWSTARAST